MNIVQRIFKNTLFLLGGNIIARLFGFVVIVYLARILGPNGFGKITAIKNYKTQGRGGSGIKTLKVTTKTGPLVSSFIVDPKNLPEEVKGDLIIISEKGQVIRLPLKSVPTLGRDTQGVRLMRLKDAKDSVANVTLV